MNVRIGDKVECLYHMSNRGKVMKIYYIPVTAESGGNGPLSKMRRIIFESEMDGKIYDMKAQELRVVRE